MAIACSSGVPLPPNGGGAPSWLPRAVSCYPMSPSLPLRLAEGGIYRSLSPSLPLRLAEGGIYRFEPITLRLPALVARGLLGVAPSLPFPRTGCARCWVGGPHSSSGPWPSARGVRCRVCPPQPLVPDCEPWERAAGCPPPPPYFPPFVAAHIKRVRSFRGTPLLVVGPLYAVRWEHALPETRGVYC